jgi:hypothetical protein
VMMTTFCLIPDMKFCFLPSAPSQLATINTEPLQNDYRVLSLPSKQIVMSILRPAWNSKALGDKMSNWSSHPTRAKPSQADPSKK